MSFFKYSNVPWHWQLAHVYGPLYDNGASAQIFNVCPYVRAVVWGAAVALLTVIVGGVFVSYIGSVAVWCLAMAVNVSYIDPNFTTLVGLVAGGVVSVAWSLVALERVIIYYTTKRITHWKDRPSPIVSSPSFIKQWYKSVKDKACVSITVHTNPR